MNIIHVVKNLEGRLPDLDKAIKSFMQGAHETFVERFLDKFKAGGDIDRMTESKLDTLYFLSMNDENEEGLGSWQHGQARQPVEIVLKFNASFMASRNETQGFIEHKLAGEGDQVYLMRTARKHDTSGHQKALKVAQIQADEERIIQNRRKETERGEKQQRLASALIGAVKNLSLTDIEIDNLKGNVLILKLECHHEIEKQRLAGDSGNGNSETMEKIPLKSHMKNKAQRVPELRKAVTRFIAQGETKQSAFDLLNSALETSRQSGEDLIYESDNDDL